MLDTRFPRPLGDIGCAETWTQRGIRVDLHIVLGIWPDKVVQSAAGLRAGRIVPAFVAVARQLERKGARAITTSCGFLVLLQKELQAGVKVPVITSSLMQLPGLLRQEKQVGVLTISASSLGKEHLRSAGVPRERLGDVLVQGVDPKGEFATQILGNQPTLDIERAGQEVVAAAVALKSRVPELRHLVLECTNMPPYRAAIEAATGMKTYALTDDVRLLKPWTPVNPP
ncbi:MAG: aspartate/glutamate racemase family protein [Comamonadaceae bacterium]|nr:MAG: aspartate/glutamate racemase family protein [Comamonadaceae bacterium]